MFTLQYIGIILTFFTKMLEKNSERFFLSGYRKSNELFLCFRLCGHWIKEKNIIKTNNQRFFVNMSILFALKKNTVTSFALYIEPVYLLTLY